jgi:hypothetical protein
VAALGAIVVTVWRLCDKGGTNGLGRFPVRHNATHGHRRRHRDGVDQRFEASSPLSFHIELASTHAAYPHHPLANQIDHHDNSEFVHILPLIFACLIAKWVGDLLTVSLIEVQQTLSHGQMHACLCLVRVRSLPCLPP